MLQEYKRSLKNKCVEDTVDLYLFRPLAFILVKLLYPLPVTPNQLSVLSIITGVISGFLFAAGTPNSFIYAGIFYGLAHTIDCCDGMIARLKQNGTPIGRIIDGFADYVSAVAMFVGFNLGLYKAGFDFFIPTWILVALSGFFMIVHSMVLDYYKSEFMAHALNIVNSTQAERAVFSAEMEKLKQQRGQYIAKLLIWFYLWYSRIQLGRDKEKIEYEASEYYQANKFLLSLWSWISAPAHILVIIASAILFQPLILFCYSLGAANLWMIVIFIIQTRRNKQLKMSKKK